MKSAVSMILVFGLAVGIQGCGGEKTGGGTENAVPFPERHDLDGDGKADKISFVKTDSAHCCLQATIALSSNATPTQFPFTMDNPYDGDVDDSQPGIFDVRNFDEDPLPEVFMKIATFRGKMMKMDTAWVRAYGISEHSILIDYSDGQLRCRNMSGSPAVVFKGGAY